MKIAMIVRRLNIKGGAQRQALELARALQAAGHAITIYTFAYSSQDCFEDLLDGVNVVVWNGMDGKGMFLRGSFFKENRKAKELAMQIDGDIDLLHPHDQVSYRVAAYYKKYVKNAPSVWMMNDVPTRQYAYWYGRRINPDFRVPLFKRIAHWLMDFYDIRKFILPQDAIAVLDNFNRENVRRFLGRDATVVRSGLDIKQFPYVERAPPDRGRVALLTTGIFMRHRRFEDIIEAVKILAERGINAALTIIGDHAGDPKYYGEMRRLVEERKLADRVSFAGKVSEEDLAAAYQRHPIFIFANDPQTWGLAVFEAMACGAPCVVSSGAGAHEVLTDGVDALIVASRSPGAIADAISRLVNDPALYRAVSKNSRAFVEERISWERYADQMSGIFQRVVMNPISRGRRAKGAATAVSRRPASNRVKTIFITSFHPHISRNILATSAFRILKARQDVRMVVVVPDYKASYFKEQFGGGNVVIEGVKSYQASATARGLLLKKLAVFFFYTDTAVARKRYEYWCEKKYVYYLVSRIAGFLGRWAVVRRVVRAADYRFSPKGFFARLCGQYQPDLIFSTDVQNENDVSLMQDARGRGVPTVGMIRSWDNPTQRAVRMFPGTMLVGSDTVKEEVVYFCGYPLDRIKVIGNPHYDRYRKGPSMTRKKFFSQFGLDPSRRTILYAPVGDHLLKHNDVDEYVMNILAATGEQVLVRFPPDEGVRLVNFVKPPQMGYDRPGMAFAQSTFTDREITPEDDQRLIDSLFYCAMAITGPTSIPLDAALIGTPSVLVNLYPTPRGFCDTILGYWCAHIKKLIAVGGVRYVQSKKELLTAIVDYFHDRGLDAPGRERMRSLWFSHADGRAGERLAQELLSRVGLE